jgi:hypothetical protein
VIRGGGAGSPTDLLDTMTADILDRLGGDGELAPALGLASPLDDGALGRAVRSLLAQALAGRRRDAGGMVTYLRDCSLDRDSYDGFGHHILSSALAHHVGPDGLMRIGAALTDLRLHVIPERRDSGAAPPEPPFAGTGRR